MDLKKFYDGLRASKVLFGASLSQPQVDGMEAIFRAVDRHGVQDVRWVANILAQVYHETGKYMSPIKETVMPSHKDKNPSDALVQQRLEKAWKAGQLPWVTSPYWRDGWFGRGQIQITHKDNYKKLGDLLGVDLVKDPGLALDPDIGASIAVVGMSFGSFRGRKLSDYFNSVSDDPSGARNIVNGDTKTMGTTIAKYHREFERLLRDSGWQPGAMGGGQPAAPDHKEHWLVRFFKWLFGG